MNPGNYKHKLDFYSVAKDHKETFYKTKKAAIKTLSVNQVLSAKAHDVIITHEIKIRYCTDIKKSMIIKKGTRVFHIETLKDFDEKHEEIVIVCREVV